MSRAARSMSTKATTTATNPRAALAIVTASATPICRRTAEACSPIRRADTLRVFVSPWTGEQNRQPTCSSLHGSSDARTNRGGYMRTLLTGEYEPARLPRVRRNRRLCWARGLYLRSRRLRGRPCGGDGCDVGMTRNEFVPEEYEVRVGETVVWKNTSGADHTVTALENTLPRARRTSQPATTRTSGPLETPGTSTAAVASAPARPTSTRSRFRERTTTSVNPTSEAVWSGRLS